MFNRISDALYRTLEKAITLVAIIAVIAFVFRYVKEVLKNVMREKRVKKMIRYYFEKKKESEIPNPSTDTTNFGG